MSARNGSTPFLIGATVEKTAKASKTIRANKRKAKLKAKHCR